MNKARPITTQRMSGAVLLVLSGTMALSSGCLNDEFFNLQTNGSFAPIAPGDTSFVVAHIVNNTSEFTLDGLIGFDAPTFFPDPVFATFQGIEAQSGRGIVLPCPLREVGLGDLEDPASAALTVILPGEGDGTGGDVTDGGQITAPASAFPVTLLNNVDFVCGDTVLFIVNDAPTAPFQVSVSAARVPGYTQTSPSGPDTFVNLQFLALPFQGPITPVDEN